MGIDVKRNLGGYIKINNIKKNIQEYLGEIGTNNKGTLMKIIAIRSLSDFDVQFLDEHKYIKEHCMYINFKNGCIKNPYDITVSTVGYIGVGIHKSSYKKHTVYQGYKAWANMLRRCYDVRYQEMFPSYMGVSIVCEEWHNYQNFADWYDENKYEVNERLHVDKDILFPGNKVYSPENCLLVPQRINMLFLNKPNHRGLPNGITKLKQGYSASYNGKICGKSIDLLEVYSYYAKAKEDFIKQIAEEYKNIIPIRLYNRLLNYKVYMEIDANYAA